MYKNPCIKCQVENCFLCYEGICFVCISEDLAVDPTTGLCTKCDDNCLLCQPTYSVDDLSNFDISPIRCKRCADGYTISLNGFNCDKCQNENEMCFYKD